MTTPRKMGDVPPDFQAALDRVTAAATAAAGKINSLRNQVKTDMTAAEVAAIQAQLKTAADGLEAATADPVPPTP